MQSRSEEIANTESSLEDLGRARLTCRAAVLGLAVAVVGEAGGDDPSTWGPSPDPIFGRNTMMSFSLKEECSPLAPPLSSLARVPDSSLPSSASDLQKSLVAMVPLRLVVGMVPPPSLGRSSSPLAPSAQVTMQLIGNVDRRSENTNLFFLSQQSLRLGLWKANSPVGVDPICPVGQSGHDVRWWRRAFAFWGLWGRFW